MAAPLSEERLEEFLRYASSLDPEFPSRIKGASAEEVERLAGLVRTDLPESLRRFLSRMGAEDGGLNLHPDGSTAISTLVGMYAEYAGKRNWVLPEGGVLLAMGGMFELALDLRCSGEPPVAMCIEGDWEDRVAPSLESLMYRRAFERLGLDRGPLRGAWRAPGAALAEGEAVAAALGFRKEPFSPEDGALGPVEGGLLSLVSDEGSLLVRASAASPSAIEGVRSLFASRWTLNPIA